MLVIDSICEPHAYMCVKCLKHEAAVQMWRVERSLLPLTVHAYLVGSDALFTAALRKMKHTPAAQGSSTHLDYIPLCAF